MDDFCKTLGYFVIFMAIIAIPLFCGLSWGLNWDTRISALFTGLTALEVIIATLTAMVMGNQ